jgi:hypothetical protein
LIDLIKQVCVIKVIVWKSPKFMMTWNSWEKS